MVDSNADSNAGDSVPAAHTGELDPAVQRTFWLSVVEANIALMAVALGVLFVAVAGRNEVGGFALFVGAVATIDLYRRVRYRPRTDEREG